MTTVEGIINGHPFRATLEPDGEKSHWLKIDKRMQNAAGAGVGDLLAETGSNGLRPPSGQKLARRIQNACDMLASGKRRVCCFDRSGIYSKGFRAPKAAG